MNKVYFIFILSFYLINICLSLELNSGSNNVSLQCTKDINSMMSFANLMDDLQLWAYSGRAPNDLGNIDGCLGLPSNVSHYCIYSTSVPVSPSINTTYIIGLCIPPSCNTTVDISSALTTFLETMSIIAPPGGDPQSICYSEIGQSYKNWTTGAYVVLGVCIFFGVLVLAGTGIEFYQNNISGLLKKDDDQFEGLISGITNNNPISIRQDLYEEINETPLVVKLLLSFSLISNYNSFFGSSSTKRHFDTLDGIRTISTIWVLLGHSLLFANSPGYDNLAYLYLKARSFFSFQAIPSAEFAVDVFFMLSGFLVAHSLLSHLNSEQSKSPFFWFKYVIHRIIRLSPLYYFLIFVDWQLMPLFGTGPLWFQYAEQKNACQEYWWTNLLYINNLHPSIMSKECFSWAWYLANDMQFYLIAPFVLLAFRFRKAFGYLIVAVLLAICFTTNIWLTMKFNIPTFFQFAVPTTTFTTDIYQKPWTRIGPYAVGIAVAFLYTHETTKKVYDKLWFRLTAYSLAFGITFFFTYIPYTSFQGSGWTKVDNALYNGFAHTMFTVGLALFMVATFYGHGGLMSAFLRLKIFNYLSKLTYATYLVHPIVLYTYYYSRTTFLHYSPIEFSWLFAGNILFAFSIAFIIHLTIEKPFIQIERLIFPPKKQNSSPPQKEYQNYSSLLIQKV
ncbi:hypothetical protein PPL_00579 [Heterostelium album PN500]|uniref:Acyltransferase 3 domain-containing protein n=1 Tax=Heterostelium pallidum (strain ATCC 26659 / Pp 5 / PN500) TaxID=670386 RepID=D3AWV1_HETP5|nr:hypothetical protein PPL_00579 [Heterostelium album PN500]EFA86774.1 hypothetical protein PPL_00579 [Heterostelium album PN500]|eukprot:XP_020438878.1 hypothetical protein PPL_00579 [Heterostelium album PN500]